MRSNTPNTFKNPVENRKLYSLITVCAAADIIEKSNKRTFDNLIILNTYEPCYYYLTDKELSDLINMVVIGDKIKLHPNDPIHGKYKLYIFVLEECSIIKEPYSFRGYKQRWYNKTQDLSNYLCFLEKQFNTRKIQRNGKFGHSAYPAKCYNIDILNYQELANGDDKIMCTSLEYHESRSLISMLNIGRYISPKPDYAMQVFIQENDGIEIFFDMVSEYISQFIIPKIQNEISDLQLSLLALDRIEELYKSYKTIFNEEKKE